MGVANALLLVFCGCLVALTPLDHASPPDPTWIPGIYDAADYDDVVSLATSSDGVAKTVDPTHSRPPLPAVSRVSNSENDRSLGSPGFSAPSRAPPSR